MSEYVIGPGGVVIPKEKAKEWLNEDGGEQKNEKVKESNFSKLTTMEKIKTKEFLAKHPELTTAPGRANLFKEAVAAEFLRLREEDDSRKAEGKAPLTEKEKELFMPVEGVISSKWRYNENQKASREATLATEAMLREAAGLGQN